MTIRSWGIADGVSVPLLVAAGVVALLWIAFLTFELQQPQAVVGLARLSRAAVELGDAGDGHALRVA